ncbi:zinc dependent phospholipase C family protein [Pontibacter sp. KCTC 32443]|uniref:zinc dependent phospholipase C family protein n=1 Tax=Pontibacter TaxID=323449 RepID=UPI00164D9E61|nr:MULTISPECIES: zinc dependent phospholipase C family protein [Pontibacter]MBC5776009.1 zinc dependent phospholipase C family protein [Pontibacter sp. KCTC 32443]
MHLKYLRGLCGLALILTCWLFATQSASAYGVLSHQAIIDASWDKDLKPLLQKRYPNATEEELKKAHAFAYGGAILQDMGYFPFGSKFFTDLLHYVRSGDFVQNLLHEAQNVNEYAFALGTLAHYNADVYGHSLGTNKAVPLVYPKLEQEFGSTVTFADHPVSHVKTEFGFDVLQVARGNYAPESYQQFIGFEVAQEPLERAFLKTYGLELGDVFVNVPLAVGTYRYTIKNLMPDLTKAAWQAKANDIKAAKPGATRRTFIYRMSRAKYNSNWGETYERPGFFTRIMAWVIKILPKVGPLRSLGFTMPTPEAEHLFYKSFNTTVSKYAAVLQQLRNSESAMENLQLDTGKKTEPGEYALTDETYTALLQKLDNSKYKYLTPELQQNILGFYKSMKPKKEQEQDEDHLKTTEALERLKAHQPAARK